MAISFVQAITPWSSGSPSTSIAFTPGAAGDCILVVAADYSNDVTSFSGTGGTYSGPLTPPGSFVDDNYNADWAIGYSLSISGASQTITATGTSGDGIAATAIELSGVGSSAITGNGTPVSAPGTGTNAIKGTAVTVPTGYWLVSCCINTSSTTDSLTSNGTILSSGSGDFNASYAWSYLTGTGASLTPEYTTAADGTDDYVVVQWLVPVASGGSGAALAGTPSDTTTGSGNLDEMSAVASDTSTGSGNLDELSGAAADTTTGAGNLDALSGVASDASTGSGNLDQMSGVATDTSVAAGNLNALLGAATAITTAAGALTTAIEFAANAIGQFAASGALFSWATVTLEEPLYTGVGSVLNAEGTWSDGVPGAGDTISYDPTYLTIDTDGSIVATSNNFSAACQWNNGGTESQLTVIVTPGLSAYANLSSAASASLTAGTQLAAAALAVTSAAASMTSGINLAGNASAGTTAAASLATGIALAGNVSSVSSAAANLLTAIKLAAGAVDTTSASAMLSVATAELIQSAVLNTAGVTTPQQVSFQTLPQAGNSIIVAVTGRVSSTPAAFEVGDNQGNQSYTTVGLGTSGSTLRGAQISFLPSVPAPSGTFTITVQGSETIDTIAIFEVSGVNAVDQWAATNSTAAAQTGLTLTNPAPNASASEFVLAAYSGAADGGTAIGITISGLGTTWTSAATEDPGLADDPVQISFGVTSAVGTSAATWEWSTAANTGGAVIASFQAELASNAGDSTTLAAALATAILADGNATAQTVLTAALTAQIQLATAATAVTSATASLVTAIAAAANASAGTVGAGSLTTQVELLGSALSITTAAANLLTQINLFASVATATVGSGTLTSRTDGAISAEATAGSVLSGNLLTQIELIGAAIAATSLISDLATQIRMAASAVSSTSVSASVLTRILLAAVASAVSTGSAELATMVKLAAQAQASSSGVGVLDENVIGVQGAAADTSSGSASLTTALDPDAAATADSNATGVLSGAGSTLIAVDVLIQVDPQSGSDWSPVAAVEQDVGDALRYGIDWTAWLAAYWMPGAQVVDGDTVRPKPPNGYQYRCVYPGITGAQPPAFAPYLGAFVSDGQAQWICEPLDSTSLTATITNVAWEASQGVTVANERQAGLITSATIDTTNATAGQPYEVTVTVTTSDGRQRVGVISIEAT
jgi:trimeric autotransporter adhesin